MEYRQERNSLVLLALLTYHKIEKHRVKAIQKKKIERKKSKIVTHEQIVLNEKVVC